MVPRRIGLLVPSTNTAVEADFQRLLGGRVTVHGARLEIPDGTLTEAALDRMNTDLARQVELLAGARVDLIVYACTSGSFYRGQGWDAEIRRTVKASSGLDCIATSEAVAMAFDALNVQRLSVVTPYPATINERLSSYYTTRGFTLLNVDGDPRSARDGHRAVNDQPPEEIIGFAREHVHADAQALFCSCTAWRAVEAVERLEQSLGIPVITSNQATIWAALRALDALDLATPAGRLFTVA